MYIVGLDISKRKARACVTTAEGTVVDERNIPQRVDELVAYFAKYPASKILVEASTSSEWVARLLEGQGHVVVVADPRYRLMYATGDKKIKTDKRDARALANALRVNAYRLAHRKSDGARAMRIKLKLRENVVKARTRLVTQVRSACEWEGVILPSCATTTFPDVVAREQMGPELRDAIETVVREVAALNEILEVADEEIAELAAHDPVIARLDAVRGIGPLTAAAFRTAVDDVGRFKSAKELTSYLGLVPSQYSSGDVKNRAGRITKAGDPLVRGYLVDAAHVIMMRRAPDTPLRRWALRIAQRSGKKKAAVALARKLARILFAMWRDGTDFDPLKTNAPDAPQPPTPEAAIP